MLAGHVEVVVFLVGAEPQVEHRLAPHRCHVSSTAGSWPQSRTPPRDGRGPNSPVPTRTSVAPSWRATSRSPDMPIESSVNPSRSRERACSAKRRPGRLGRAVRRDRHDAPDVEPEIAQPFDEARGHRRRAAALLLLTRRVHLCEHRGAGGVAGDLGAERQAVDAVPQRHERRRLAHLVALEPTDGVPPRGRSIDGCGAVVDLGLDLARLDHQLLHVALADVGQPGVEGGAHRVGTEPLGDRDESDRGRVGRRGRDAPSHRVQAVG